MKRQRRETTQKKRVKRDLMEENLREQKPLAVHGHFFDRRYHSSVGRSKTNDIENNTLDSHLLLYPSTNQI